MTNNRSNDTFDPFSELTTHAGQLNGIRRRGLFGVPYYEMMSGAVIWTDETNRHTPVEVVWALRMLWAYRTSVMLNKPREELSEYWEFGREEFPQWVGFRPERRMPTDRLLRIYRRGNTSVRKCLRDLEREGDSISLP